MTRWIVSMLMIANSGCALYPALGTLASGGVTLYKSAKETGPKVEVVLVKLEVNHTVVNVTKPESTNEQNKQINNSPNPKCRNCQPSRL